MAYIIIEFNLIYYLIIKILNYYLTLERHYKIIFTDNNLFNNIMMSYHKTFVEFFNTYLFILIY